MTYKLIVLAASAGGKSTLMRQLRQDPSMQVMEMDEELMIENGGAYPEDDQYKNEVLIPRIVENVFKQQSVIYLSSYVPRYQMMAARDKGFIVVLLELTLDQLRARNQHRMATEGYADATSWLPMQLSDFKQLKQLGLIDYILDGQAPPEGIAQQLTQLAGRH